MIRCAFAADLHGSTSRYDKLSKIIALERPQGVFLGGDLLPSFLQPSQPERLSYGDFIEQYMVKEFSRLREEMQEAYPRVFVIMGNDDGRLLESLLEASETHHLWEYVHMRSVLFGRFRIYGYSYIPPTPFFLKDWERYDVSRYTDPGCISPEEGKHSVPVDMAKERRATIREDLDRLAGEDNLDNAVFLFHAPPYGTNLDRTALDGRMIDHVPIDPHIGSIAIRRFIEARQPLLTLHGHVHESAALTHSWQDRIGQTFAFSAAHEGPELAVVRFDLEHLDGASRELV